MEELRQEGVEILCLFCRGRFIQGSGGKPLFLTCYLLPSTEEAPLPDLLPVTFH